MLCPNHLTHHYDQHEGCLECNLEARSVTSLFSLVNGKSMEDALRDILNIPGMMKAISYMNSEVVIQIKLTPRRQKKNNNE